MTGIKRIGSELFRKDCSTPFKSLKTPCFEDFQEWEHWDPVEENKDVEIFPRLDELSLVKCPKLRGKLPEIDYHWFKLRIEECGVLEVLFTRLPWFCEAEIDGHKTYLIEDTELGYEVQMELRQLVSSDS
ncbi:putative disease resistance RPP13-like protein 1 [Pistacia vera]|uniref:putative disease resistance RPP13-like protein 1 n=1 Tax=Pistacia vera TaxID=55513 RepID=UPI0012632A2A|nr:putative disease resistance RPP13-like protein 1 [Pistacia vera]